MGWVSSEKVYSRNWKISNPPSKVPKYWMEKLLLLQDDYILCLGMWFFLVLGHLGMLFQLRVFLSQSQQAVDGPLPNSVGENPREKISINFLKKHKKYKITRKLKFPYHCLRKVDKDCKTADARDNSGGEFATRNRCNKCAVKHRFAPKITFVPLQPPRSL